MKRTTYLHLMSSLRISGAKTPLTGKASWRSTVKLSLKSEFRQKEVVWIIRVAHNGHFLDRRRMNKFYDNVKKNNFWRTLHMRMKLDLLTFMHINFKVGTPTL